MFQELKIGESIDPITCILGPTSEYDRISFGDNSILTNKGIIAHGALGDGQLGLQIRVSDDSSEAAAWQVVDSTNYDQKACCTASGRGVFNGITVVGAKAEFRAPNDGLGWQVTDSTGANQKAYCNSTGYIYTKSSVYAALGFDQGSSSKTNSDIRVKNSILPLSSAYSTLFDNLQPVSYKYNDGTSDRTHTGFIVQHVLEAMEKAGLTTQDFAAVCHEENEQEEIWRLRYEELIALCVNEIQMLKKEIKQLKGQS